jgi:hypothetical protein
MFCDGKYLSDAISAYFVVPSIFTMTEIYFGGEKR